MAESQENGDMELQEGKQTNKEQVPGKPIDLDYILTNELGQFGWFQLKTVLLLVLLLIINGTMGEYIFSAAATQHRCRIPECEEEGKYEFDAEWITNAIPETSSGFASCERYSPRGSNSTLDFCPANLFDQSNTIACDGFVYASNNTVVYEFDLGCNEWLRALGGTLYNIGTLLALPITGYISDHFGRRTALIICILNLALFGVIRAFSVNYTMYVTLQIMQTTFGSGAYSSSYIIGKLKIWAVSWSDKFRWSIEADALCIGVTTSAMFALGEALLGSIAWLISPWRYVIMATTIPGFFFVSYYWLITESVRWLLSKKKYTEAKNVLLTIARVNKTQITEKSLEALINPPQSTTIKTINGENLGLVRTIIRSPILLRRVCTTPFWWITMTFIFYGLSINSTSLSGIMHLNYILTSLISIPGFYTSACLSDIIGRKRTVTLGFFVSAACNICFVFIPKDLTIPRLIVYLFGKFSIAAVGTMLYLYTSELYPTEYRHSLLGFSSMIGRIGSVFAPLIPALMSYYHGLPSLLFGGMGILSGLLVLTQPETLGCKMPDTLAEAEAIGRPESRITAR